MVNSVCFFQLGVFLKRMLPVLCLSLGACAGGQSTGVTVQLDMPKKVQLLAGDSKALNYTHWYIHSFALFGPSGSGIGGGGRTGADEGRW